MSDSQRPAALRGSRGFRSEWAGQCLKRKEIYKYEAPWTVYAMNWSVRPDKRFRLALGSFVEEYNNKVGRAGARNPAGGERAPGSALSGPEPRPQDPPADLP